MARYTVGASSDDSAQTFGATTNAFVNQNLSLSASGTNDQYVGIRLASVTKASLVSLGSVTMQVTADQNKNMDMDCDVYCEAADNSATFTTNASDLSGRARTTASVRWTATIRPGPGPNAYSASPDLITILTEVTNRAGWVDGNAVSFILVARSASLCVFNSFDNAKNLPPFVDLLPSAPPLGTPLQGPGHMAPQTVFSAAWFRQQSDQNVVPAFPFALVTQPRRLRGMQTRRAIRAEVVPPQAPAPPFIKQRQVRGQRRVRPRTWEVVPPQFNPPYPWAAIARFKPVRSLLRRGKQFAPILLQFNPPYPWAAVTQPRRLRGLLRRITKPISPVPAQVFPPVIPIPTDWTRPWRVRGTLSRRGHRFEVVPPQKNPPFPFAPIVQKRSLRSLLRRGKVSEPVWPQFNPPYPWSLVKPFRVPRALRHTRGRQSMPVPPQFAPLVEHLQRRRTWRPTQPRTRAWQVVPDQVVYFQSDVPWSRNQLRTVRGLLRRKSRTTLYIFRGSSGGNSSVGLYLERDAIRIIPLVTDDGITWRPRGTL